MTTLREKIEVMQAAERGEAIEYQCSSHQMDDEWYPTKSPMWQWNSYQFRVKPKPREIWVNEYKNETSGYSKYHYCSREKADTNASHSRIAVVRFVEAERILLRDKQ